VLLTEVLLHVLRGEAVIKLVSGAKGEPFHDNASRKPTSE
jgi:hypothetical protein